MAISRRRVSPDVDKFLSAILVGYVSAEDAAGAASFARQLRGKSDTADSAAFARAILGEGDPAEAKTFARILYGKSNPAETAAFVYESLRESDPARAAKFLREYDPDEPRDEKGRWTTGGSTNGANRGESGATLGDLSKWLSKIAPSDAAKAEAARIAAAIKNTFDKNNPWYWPSLTKDQRNKGYYCYQWAYAFEDAFNSESSGKFFAARVEEASDSEGHVHFWVAITSKSDPKNTVYVDDGFCDGDYVHSKRPIPDGWSLGTPGDKPREKVSVPPAYDSNGNQIYAPGDGGGGEYRGLPPTIFGPYYPDGGA